MEGTCASLLGAPFIWWDTGGTAGHVEDRRRFLLSLFAGPAGVLFVMVVGSIIARALWPGYALAAGNRAFTLTMLIARLSVGAFAVLLGSLMAARTSPRALLSSAGTGSSVLAVSIPWHVHIWSAYPPWYHAVYLGYILPAAFMGYAVYVAVARRTSPDPEPSDAKVRQSA